MTKSWYTNPNAIYWRNAGDLYAQIPNMAAVSHLPDNGFAPRLMGIADFANGETLIAKVSCRPKNPIPEPTEAARRWGHRTKSSAHRLFTQCPGCQKYIPSGRMHQHFPIHEKAGWVSIRPAQDFYKPYPGELHKGFDWETALKEKETPPTK